MTFRQLIYKYSFDDIIPELNEIWDKGNLYLFRQAFAILRSLEPASGQGSIIVKRVEGETGSYNRVCNLSGYDWHENLGWEIIVDSNIDISEKQLLALCLWERSFYGFSPQQQQATFDQWDEESETGYCEDPINEKMELVDDICSKYPGVNLADLNFALDRQEANFHTFTGWGANRESAVKFIMESIELYFDPLASTSVEQGIALLCASDDFMPNDREIALLQKTAQTKIGMLIPQIHKRRVSGNKTLRLTVIF